MIIFLGLEVDFSSIESWFGVIKFYLESLLSGGDEILIFEW